jgi:hypothetical protein
MQKTAVKLVLLVFTVSTVSAVFEFILFSPLGVSTEFIIYLIYNIYKLN